MMLGGIADKQYQSVVELSPEACNECVRTSSEFDFLSFQVSRTDYFQVLQLGKYIILLRCTPISYYATDYHYNYLLLPDSYSHTVMLYFFL